MVNNSDTLLISDRIEYKRQNRYLKPLNFGIGCSILRKGRKCISFFENYLVNSIKQALLLFFK